MAKLHAPQHKEITFSTYLPIEGLLQWACEHAEERLCSGLVEQQRNESPKWLFYFIGSQKGAAPLSYGEPDLRHAYLPGMSDSQGMPVWHRPQL